MIVRYDDAVDAVTPHGAVELTDGINVDTTSDGHIAGIEILNASTRIDLKTIFNYSLEVDTGFSTRKIGSSGIPVTPDGERTMNTHLGMCWEFSAGEGMGGGGFPLAPDFAVGVY